MHWLSEAQSIKSSQPSPFRSIIPASSEAPFALESLNPRPTISLECCILFAHPAPAHTRGPVNVLSPLLNWITQLPDALHETRSASPSPSKSTRSSRIVELPV